MSVHARLYVCAELRKNERGGTADTRGRGMRTDERETRRMKQERREQRERKKRREGESGKREFCGGGSCSHHLRLAGWLGWLLRNSPPAHLFRSSYGGSCVYLSAVAAEWR